MRASVAFPALALFDLLREPIRMLPSSISAYINGSVAQRRLQELLGVRIAGRLAQTSSPGLSVHMRRLTFRGGKCVGSQKCRSAVSIVKMRCFMCAPPVVCCYQIVANVQVLPTCLAGCTPEQEGSPAGVMPRGRAFRVQHAHYRVHQLAASTTSQAASQIFALLCAVRVQLPEVSQRPSLPLPGSGEPAVALSGASFAWKAASEGGQPTVQDATLEVCSCSS